MAEKKAILLMLPSVALSGASEALDKLKKKAVPLANADSAGLEALALELGGKKVEAAALEGAEDALLVVQGDEAALAAALEAADRRTLVVVAAADGYIAAIASVHDFAVATRDTSPFAAAGLQVINPFLC